MAKPTAQDAVNYARRFPCSDDHARYIAKNYLMNNGENLEETLGLIAESEAIISGVPAETMQPIETTAPVESLPPAEPVAELEQEQVPETAPVAETPVEPVAEPKLARLPAREDPTFDPDAPVVEPAAPAPVEGETHPAIKS